MSDPNNHISNGTCYTAAGSKLNEEFIPCGNDAFGHQTCCGAGDNCLADKACFGFHGSGYGSSLTYWAGCTDPDYKDASCPKKEVDQPWVALTLCDNSDGEWAICSQKGDPTTLQPGAYCSCTNAASATVAFSDSTILSSFASLPKSDGQSIQFLGGHSPSSVLASSTAAATQDSGSTTKAGASSTASKSTNTGKATVTVLTSGSSTITSSTTLSPSPSDSSSSSSSSPSSPGGGSGGGSSSNLSRNAIIGIGVGAGVGGLLIATIIALLILRYQRRGRRSQRPGVESVDDKDNSTMLFDPVAGDKKPLEDKRKRLPVKSPEPPVLKADGSPMAEADAHAAEPWTVRSELRGSWVPREGMAEAEAAAVHGRTTPLAELPGSENYAGEQGAQRTLRQEANLQLGPGWRDQTIGRAR
ncbi:MAG: hypothetical protein Q9227_000377 [Pyrenula ochraceoflavens]